MSTVTNRPAVATTVEGAQADFVHEVSKFNTVYSNGFARSSIFVCTCGRGITGRGPETTHRNFEKHVKSEAEKAERKGDRYRALYADRGWNFSVVIAPLGDTRKGSQKRLPIEGFSEEDAVANVTIPEGFEVVRVDRRTRAK